MFPGARYSIFQIGRAYAVSVVYVYQIETVVERKLPAVRQLHLPLATAALDLHDSGIGVIGLYVCRNLTRHDARRYGRGQPF